MDGMFICPTCNIEVEDPAYKKQPRGWYSRGVYRPPVPICPSGHWLKTSIGHMREMPLALSFLRSAGIACAFLTSGLLPGEGGTMIFGPHFILVFVTSTLLVIGMAAFDKAWTWAGMEGPVKRLVPRACGAAFGYLIPAVVSCHALYFDWVNRVREILAKSLNALVHFAFQGHVVS